MIDLSLKDPPATADSIGQLAEWVVSNVKELKMAKISRRNLGDDGKGKGGNFKRDRAKISVFNIMHISNAYLIVEMEMEGGNSNTTSFHHLCLISSTKIFYTKPKPAYGWQGLYWIVGPEYSFGVVSLFSIAVLSGVQDTA